MFDPSPDLFVRAVVVLLPLAQFAAGRAAVRDYESGALVAAVGDCRGSSYGLLRPGFGPRLAVVAVAGHWPSDRDDQASIGIDDDLVVR